MILVDLQRAFDTFDHWVLLEKMKYLVFEHRSSPQSLSEAGSYLYADNACMFYQREVIKKIENVLKKDFSSEC